MHQKRDVSLLICFLLLFNDFGPASFARVNFERQKREKADHASKHEETQSEERLRRHEVEKKSATTRLAQEVLYRFLSISKHVVPKMVAISRNSNSVLNATAQCCGKYPEICKDLGNITKLQEKIRQQGDEIDTLQLEANNLQQWTESTRSKFTMLISEMANIVDNSESLLKSMSPRSQPALKQKVKDIEEEIKGNEESMDFSHVVSSLKEVIASVVGSATAIYDLIFPSTTKVTKFASDRYVYRMAKQLNNSLDVTLQAPTGASNISLSANGWLAKTRAEIKTDFKKIKKEIDANYRDSVEVLDEVAKKLFTLYGLLGTSQDLYSDINDGKTCKEKMSRVNKGVKTLKKGSAILDSVRDDIGSSKRLIEKAWKVMADEIADRPFQHDLKQIYFMLLDIPRPNTKIENIGLTISYFLRDIPRITSQNMYEALYRKLESLTLVIKQIAFTVNCFTDKVKMMNYITTECSHGTAAIDDLYETAITLFDTNSVKCERNLGLPHIGKDVVKKNFKDIAKILNFKEDCVINSSINKKYACQLKNNGYGNTEIAKRMKLNVEAIGHLVKDCPKVAITPALKSSICKLKMFLTDEQIAVSLKLKVGDIKSVEC